MFCCCFVLKVDREFEFLEKSRKTRLLGLLGDSMYINYPMPIKMEVIIINQVFISCICRMRKFGIAAMMTLPMALIGMEMEMQDGDFDSKYCQLAMFALVL